jgi:hypothetical protein
MDLFGLCDNPQGCVGFLDVHCYLQYPVWVKCERQADTPTTVGLAPASAETGTNGVGTACGISGKSFHGRFCITAVWL